MPGMNSPFGPPQSQEQMIQALMQHLAQQGQNQSNMASQMGQNPLMQQMAMATGVPPDMLNTPPPSPVPPTRPPLTPDSPLFNPDSSTGRFPTRSPRP